MEISSSTERAVRVRFAPSPTGGLHLGGVRTVLYNYLFARHHRGTFVLRIEDTDQSRYVSGAEEYIFRCLEWCGLAPDESPLTGGAYGPYRQSERKAGYAQYAQRLVESGHAYYAFDTPEELDAMRTRLTAAGNASPQYDRHVRAEMRNSLSLSADETARLMADGRPWVVRVKMPESGSISLNDAIRGPVSFDLSLVDDKVLLKRDGMPTYHLAVVVDDYLMEITHAFRGEEWLPSAPVHLFLWEALGWKENMPQWAHLPLILGPDGAKLSKRHGSKYGFPIFAMNWTDPKSGDFTEGFRERGFLPEAFVNLLALLGWNDGTEQEIFSMDELIQRFDLSRVSQSGAAFDYEKARWYNHHYIQQKSAADLLPLLRPYMQRAGYVLPDDGLLIRIISAVKERLYLLSDIGEHSDYFFAFPELPDYNAIRAKWSPALADFFSLLKTEIMALAESDEAKIEEIFNSLLHQFGLKKGEAMLPLRIMLVGGKYGPGVFLIASILGKAEAAARIGKGIAALQAA